MKTESFNKIKKYLEEEKQQNNDKISLLNEKIRMLKANSFYGKAFNILGFSTLGYLLVFFTSAILIKNIGVDVFTNIIPALCYPVVVVGSSLCIGTVINNSMYRKYRVKERLNDFSTSKTQKQKLEEETYYEIELEKLNNRNSVIEQSISVLESDKLVLERFSSKYDISDKNTTKSEEEIRKQFEGRTIFLKHEYDKLDALSTQKVLHNKFWQIRSKAQKRIEMTLTAILCGLFIMIFTAIPLIIVSNAITYNPLFVCLAITFSPFVVSTIATGCCMSKRNKDYNEVFSNFNSKLEENALPDSVDNYYSANYECEELKSLIDEKIKDISLVEVELNEELQVLENIISKEESGSKAGSKEKTYNDMLYDYEKDEVEISQEKGPMLIKKR